MPMCLVFFLFENRIKSKIEKPCPSRCSTEGLCWAASAQVRLPQHSVPQIRCSAGTRDVCGVPRPGLRQACCCVTVRKRYSAKAIAVQPPSSDARDPHR